VISCVEWPSIRDIKALTRIATGFPPGVGGDEISWVPRISSKIVLILSNSSDGCWKEKML